MPTITEKRLTFNFPATWSAQKFDESNFYRNQFLKIALETKGVDIVALDDYQNLWLIEVKDYRHLGVAKVKDLPQAIAKKVRDTLSCYMAARVSATDPAEKQFAQEATQARRYQVVLHMELFTTHSRLTPRVVNPANFVQKLKQLVKSVDAHPQVVDMNSLNYVRWTVT